LTASARKPGSAPKLAIAAVCLVSVVGLQGCVEKPAATARLPVYAYDQTGAARHCTVPPVKPVADKQTDATISVENDGGWCAFSVQQGRAPYTVGLVTARPQHGKVFVHSVGDETRIDYTPAPSFAGADSFTVKLLPGDALVAVAATVTPSPQAAPPAPPPAPEPKAAAPAKKKRAAVRR